MSFKDLANKAKHLVIEEDETKPVVSPAVVPPAHVSAPAAHPAFNLGSMGTATGTAPAPVAGSPFAVPGTAVLDEKVYQSVLSKTNFDATPVGKAVHKYYDALEGTGMTTDQRFKAAMKQAAALDNITSAQVLATFDQMSASLDSDAQGFQKIAETMQANQITARQQKLQSIADQVASLNQQATQIGNELADAQINHDNAVQQYGLAQSRRAQEIAAQKTQFAALLQ